MTPQEILKQATENHAAAQKATHDAVANYNGRQSEFDKITECAKAEMAAAAALENAKAATA